MGKSRSQYSKELQDTLKVCPAITVVHFDEGGDHHFNVHETENGLVTGGTKKKIVRSVEASEILGSVSKNEEQSEVEEVVSQETTSEEQSEDANAETSEQSKPTNKKKSK